MTEPALSVLRVVTALGCGLMAGVYFAFSTAVMAGLGRLEPTQGITTMQSINRAIINPLFLAVFLGTAILCAILGVSAFGKWSTSSAALLLVGTALYLAGSLMVTIMVNVPMNNTLDALAPADSDSARRWAGYLRDWTAWNHLRAIASLVAALLLIIA